MSESSREEELEMLAKAARALGEHFDSVMIFASRYQPNEGEGTTLTMNSGVGNWHTRYGQVREWLIKADEQGRIDERKHDD